jgi:hypothetical protein
MDPQCANLWHFLEGSDSYMDYQYFICLDCNRIWESSRFYQDWEPHWTILSWEQFEAKPERWKDQTGVDHRPAEAMENGIEGLRAWAIGLTAPVSLQY